MTFTSTLTRSSGICILSPDGTHRVPRASSKARIYFGRQLRGLSARQLRFRGGMTTICSLREHNREVEYYQLEPHKPLPAAPKSVRTWTGFLAVFSIAAIVAGLYYRFQYDRARQAQPEVQDEFLHGPLESESEEFKMVLGSVRQAVSFQRAVQSMRSGDTARAMVELYRVLEENALCRARLTIDNYSKDDLEDIYRLHLQNSELPAQYSTLLHLRQILDLDRQRAEEIEAELKSSAYVFSI